MEVSFYGVHGNPNTIGFCLDWSSDSEGFGQLRIYQNVHNGNIEIESESMGKEFAKKVLCALVDNATVCG